MPQANRDGRFRARLDAAAINETGDNKLTTWVGQFTLIEEMRGGEWMDIAGEDLQISHYAYLEKKNGSINEIAVKSLKESLGWDGSDPFWLQDSPELVGTEVQLTLGWEEYNGQQRLKAQWLNHRDSTGGQVSPADEATKQRIRNRIGSKLRAISGGTPAPATKPKSAPPKSPPATPPVHGSTYEEAWNEFTQACATSWDQEKCEQEWWRLVKNVTGTTDTDSFTPADWAKIKAAVATEVAPF